MVLLPIDAAIELILASQGISKGLRQTDGAQALGRAEIAAGPIFAAASFKNVTSATADGEANLQIGVRRSFGGFALSAAIAYKFNTGAGLQADRDAIEFTASATRRIGPLTPRVAVTYSGDELGTTTRSLFIEAGAGVQVGPGLTLSGNVARRERGGGPDYTAFNAGLTFAFHTLFSADLRYYDTNRSGLGEIYRPRVVASLRARF
jgi:predicted porin